MILIEVSPMMMLLPKLLELNEECAPVLPEKAVEISLVG